MTDIEIIYLDMDGVLCDFHLEFKIKSGVDVAEYEKTKGSQSLWKFINDAGVDFWENMTPMKDMEDLKSFVFKNFVRVGILSSSSKKNGSIYADEGKRLWLKKYNFTSQIDASDIIIVGSAQDKQKYAGPGKILVDDYKNNIDSWRAKGGIGIQHFNANRTIGDLERINAERIIKELYRYV